jgi:AraC-like DNA-binding protein
MKKNELQYNILYSCTDEKERSSENLLSDHVITYILSGKIQFYVNQVLVEYKSGQMALLRKNLLLRSFKYPGDDGKPFQSLNVFLSEGDLRTFSAAHNVAATGVYNDGPIFDLSEDVFIKGYFDSLVPYFNTDVPLNAHLAGLKTNEAIELVLRHKKLANLLLDFAAPYKIDLEAFMSQNYTYNIPMSKFALLTGRSLATFKRDFKKIFHSSPEKWLVQKRLEAAHFLIAQKKQPPSAVFQDVGFENFSHFSTAFKRRFGYNASALAGL